MSYQILQGHVLDRLRDLPDNSVHCCVTSPPYWGLRDYGIPPSIWGGSAECKHVWDLSSVPTEVGRGNWAQGTNGRGEVQPGGVDEARKPIRSVAESGYCRMCGAWLGAFGLEPTPQLYLDHAVMIFAEVGRVLRKDGTLWLNIGDCYATGAGSVGNSPGGGERGAKWAEGIGPMTQPNRMPQRGLKPKDLCMMPARVAIALQADGWYLRCDIIWHKPNPMPESVTDRPTKSHEYIFLLSKSQSYYYDADAIREPLSKESADRYKYSFGGSKNEALVEADQNGIGNRTRVVGERETPDSRNKRSVWTVSTAPYSEAHCATFPPRLIEPCILAGCPVDGTVLDPFSGSGTTGLVALRHGRNYIGIELNPEYVAMSHRRITEDQPLLNQEAIA